MNGTSFRAVQQHVFSSGTLYQPPSGFPGRFRTLLKRILSVPFKAEVNHLSGQIEHVGKPVIYTLGTSTRALREFLEILKRHGIALVADVQRFPRSTRHPHFSRPNLSLELSANGVAYHYLGDKLGGYRPGGYEAYTWTETFRKGMEELVSLAKWVPTAILCSERLPWKCHRRFIAAHLARENWRVVHIIDAERVYIPQDAGSGHSRGSPENRHKKPSLGAGSAPSLQARTPLRSQ